MFRSKRHITQIRARLLKWYHQYRRNLPWRNTTDAYCIWISEIMAQQTRLETVVPYYQRFITRFPNVSSLARAKEESILKLWEGLGYYSRARNLHAAAKEVVETYGGQLPQEAQELQKLKGFGPYTSASVASIAFGQAVACVDGNVRRVLSRLLATQAAIDDAAQVLVDPEDPSSFNQGLMELGARVCTPRNPKCEECPLKGHCLAFAENSVHLFPAKKAKTKLTTRHLSVFILRTPSETLLLKRSSKGLWGGLWELPTIETSKNIGEKEQSRAFFKAFGFRLPQISPVGSFTHILSHQKIYVSVYEGKMRKPKTSSNAHWLTPKQLKRRPLSRLQQKALTPNWG